MNEPAHVLVLCDDRPGHANQAFGVAEALGLPFQALNLAYRSWAKTLPMLPVPQCLHLTEDARKAVALAHPDLVIGCGHRTAPIAAWLKRHHGCLWAQLMTPPAMLGRMCDLIAAPAHDNLPESDRLVTTIGAANRITQNRLHDERVHWHERYGGLATPRLGILLGGDTRTHRWSRDDQQELIAFARQWIADTSGAVMVTTSRRTPQDVGKAFRQALSGLAADIHEADITAGDNPYFGLLSWSDHLLVTADSASLMSEACTVGCGVSIYTPKAGIPTKLEALRDRLIRSGHAESSLTPPQLDRYSGVEPLDDAGKIAMVLRELIKKRRTRN